MLTPTPTPFSAKQVAPEVSLTTGFACNLRGKAEVTISYTPDKMVLKPQDFETWLAVFQKQTWGTWEELGDALTHQFYDTLLPQVVRLEVDIPQAEKATAQKLAFTQKQPKR